MARRQQKLGSPTKRRLRRTAKRYARTSGKSWVEEINDLYARTQARRRSKQPWVHYGLICPGL